MTGAGHTPIRVVIADDEALVRAGIRAILASDERIQIVGETQDGLEAVERVRAQRPDVAVLDIRMPRGGGIEATREIRRLGLATAVVILTTFSTDDNTAQAVEGGADGFLIKASAPRDLIEGIVTVAGGGSALSGTVARLVLRRLRESATVADADALGLIAGLTERAAVACGQSCAGRDRRLRGGHDQHGLTHPVDQLADGSSESSGSAHVERQNGCPAGSA